MENMEVNHAFIHSVNQIFFEDRSTLLSSNINI